MNDRKYGPLHFYGLSLGGGVLGFVLRLAMLHFGYEGPVQLRGHWTYICLWVLSLGVLGVLAYICRGMGKDAGMEGNIRPSLPACLGGVIAAAMLLLAGLMALLSEEAALVRVGGAFLCGAALALGMEGILRYKGESQAATGLITACASALYLISRFRAWSIDPLLGDYLFRFMAAVFAMLAAFELSGFALGKGRRPVSLFCSGACVFFCLISLADSGLEQRLYFGAMGLWQLLGSCNTAMPPKPRRVLGGGREEC